MKHSFYTILLLTIALSVRAQANFTISGQVVDTLNFEYTQYTAVSLIRASDSILIAVARADAEGRFSLTAKEAGDYLLLFEHPLFASYVYHRHLDGKEVRLGKINLISRERLIDEIKIIGQNAITIKGDTIEYLADSFKTGQYDDVEALLRQLPGIEVGSDGSIKAQGKKVEKMLVDGDEFFSDDPAMVTKMLRASSVDAVQVFDKKSEAAEFTGIDDGEKIKTINLKLKEDAKQGYFGKISAGGGWKDYWENSAMINAFKKRRKISAYAIMSNTNKGGLNFQENQNFGSGRGVFSYNGGRVSLSNPGDAYGNNGSFSGQGLPKTWNGGVHYGNKWKGDSLTLNGDYSLAKNEMSALNNTTSQYILPDTQYFNYSDQERNNTQLNQNLSLRSSYDLDSMSSLSFQARGTIGNSRSESRMKTQARTVEGGLLNENNQYQGEDGSQQNGNTTLRYRRRFMKKGRSISASINGSLNYRINEGFQQSDYHLYAIDSTKVIDQKKVNKNESQSIGATLNYTEPLTDKLFLLLNYNFNLNNQKANLQSYNRGGQGGGFSDVLDSLYSSDYRYRILGNRGGLSLRFNPSEQITMNLGGDISNTGYLQEDLMFDTITRYSYLNLYPKFNFKYSKNRYSNLNFSYNGRSNQPTLNQLQPVRNNEDPLNIAIGNPDLKQSFLHSFSLFYYNYKVMSSQSLYASLDASFAQNDIVQKQNTDFSGRRTYQYVNVDGNYWLNAYGGYGRGIVKNLNFNIALNGSYNQSHNFINEVANINHAWSIAPRLNLNYNLDTTLVVYYSFTPSYNNTVSSIRRDITTDYWNFNQSLNVSYQLPWRLKIGTEALWEFRQQLDVNDRQNKVFLWNAFISRAFLPDQSLVAEIYANDLLNQNVGYRRVATSEQISEVNYNTIKRYFMIRLTWNFTKTGTGKSPEGANGNMIITN